MIVLNKIYTRTGDAGETALGDGSRTRKDSIRVETYGTVDEVNGLFGVARLHAEGETAERIAAIQNDLFDLGADLCRPARPDDAQSEYPPLRMSDAQVERLEQEMDEMTATLEPLRSFVLPGGSALAAHLHQCRTVARRAERLAIALTETEEVTPAALRYLNRLSDWCFCAARMANDAGRADVLWTPGENR